MSKHFFEGGAYHFLTTLSQLVVVGILWLFTSIPLITLGASTAALYYSIVTVIREDSTDVTKKYFRAFRENFKQSLVPSILLMLYGVVMTMELSDAYLGKSGHFLPPFAWFVIALLLLTFCITLFALMARYQTSLPALVYLAFTLLFQNVKVSFGLLGMLIVSALIILYAPGLGFILPGIVLFFYSFLLEPVFLQYIKKLADAS